MVILGQKLEFEKTCEKRLYKHIKVVLCKKTAPKNTYYSKNYNFLKMGKIGHQGKAIVFAKNGQFGSKIKIRKNMRKTTLQTH